MEQLLDEVDSSLHPGLAALAGNWCESCEALRQEVKRLQDDQVQNFGKLKQKIISTDLLIKKYKSKCDDYDSQSKKLEETTRRLEKAQRQSETLELQLKSSLLETEPLRKNKQSLEAELRMKNVELEAANNKMICAQGLQKQVQGENKYLQDQVDKLEGEKRELKEKLNHYRRTEKDEETVKHMKGEIVSLKKEVTRINKENNKLQKKEQGLELKLHDTTEKMNHYCTMLKQHKLMSAAKKSLSHHRSPGKSCATSDSDTSFDFRDSLLQKDIRKSIEDSESSEDDDHSLFQVPWSFSPMVKCLSPLPPSPAVFSQRQAGMVDDNDEDEDDEYLSDLAEELESQLLDILSEDEITELPTTDKIDQQNTENLSSANDSASIDNADGACLINDASSNARLFEHINENIGIDNNTAACSEKAEHYNQTKELDKQENIYNEINLNTASDVISQSDEESLSSNSSDNVCKDILDNIVNEILGDSIAEIEKQNDVSLNMNIEQTVYCDDTTLIKTSHQKTKQNTHSVFKNKNENHPIREEKEISDISEKTDSVDSNTFKSPKTLKERLRDSVQEISPISTRQSSEKHSKSGAKSSLCYNLGSVESDNKNRNDVAQTDKCLVSTNDQILNLNRSDTGEFTPILHEIESPSPSSKGKTRFFIADQETSCVHSLQNVKSPANNHDSAIDNDITDNAEISCGAQTNAKPVLKRQMALRKDSNSDLVPEKKVCSSVNEEDKGIDHDTKRGRRTKRSKSMPDKFIKFQKGSCETLADEMVKYDVSKGGYEEPKSSENSVACKLTDNDLIEVKLTKDEEHNPELKDQHKEVKDKKSDEMESKNVIELDIIEESSPIATRTRRSSRVMSLSDSQKEKLTDTKGSLGNAHSIKTCTNINLKKLNSNESFKNVEKKHLLELAEEKQEKVITKEDSENSRSEQSVSKNETCYSKSENKQSDLPIDFRGDSAKSAQKQSVSKTMNADIIVGLRVEANHSSPCSEETASKVSPARQISTGFLLANHHTSDTKTDLISPIIAHETITEESEEKMDFTDNVNDVPTVILDVSDIFNDNINDDTRVNDIHVSDENLLNVKEKTNMKDLQVIDPLNQGNDKKGRDHNESLSEDISSPISKQNGLFQSASQNMLKTEENNPETLSTASLLDLATSGDKSAESRSHSATPDDLLYDIPVLSPLPISPFELVNLISPLPPTPTPVDEPLSPLPEVDETEHEDVLKSPEIGSKIQKPEFDTPESKSLINKVKLCLNEVPEMLSPIITPKRHKPYNSVVQKETEQQDDTPRPCKFISEVPIGIINVKPKAVHVSDLSEFVNQKNSVTEKQNDKGLADRDKNSSIINSNLKENKVPNITNKQKNKSKILKATIKNITAAGKSTSDDQPDNVKSDTINVVDKIVKAQTTVAHDPASTNNHKTVGDSGNTKIELASKKGVPETSGGYDNLVASKTKTRQAHQPKTPRLPVKKPIPIIEAPVLPTNRKRKSIEQEKPDKEREKEVADKKPCKEHVFKRRQKSESKAKTAANKLMQNYLKSTDPPESVISKFETEAGEGEDTPQYKAVTTCFECLSRIRNDTLEAVHESCSTEDYLNIIDDWPYLFPVEKQAVELCWHISQEQNQVLTRASIMEELWKRIFNIEHGTSISGKKSLCRLFTAICLKAGNVEEVRVLCYHIVLCGYMNVTSFLVPIISVWPETLCRENDDDHGMVMVLEYLIMQLLTQDNPTTKQIKECAVKLCNWVEDREPAESILVKLVKKLQEAAAEECSCPEQVFELSKSLELLSLKEGFKWFYQYFVCQHCLQTVSNKWQSKGRSCGLTSQYVCSALRITATILSHFSGNSKQFSDTIRHWILPILRKEPSCPDVRNCCIEVLLELSCYNPKVMINLQGWYYMFKGTIRPDLEVRMENLRQEYCTKFGLLCDPIRRKFKPQKNQ